jgi:hypothetical protein
MLGFRVKAVVWQLWYFGNWRSATGASELLVSFVWISCERGVGLVLVAVFLECILHLSMEYLIYL